MSGPKLPLVGLPVAAWAVLPPYAGPGLLLDPTVEVIDHVVPGLVVLAVSLAALAVRRRAAGTPMLAAGLLVTLAGFWMTVTHLPLVAQALRGQAPAVAAGWHTAPGLVVMTLGAVWAVRLGQLPAERADTDRDEHHAAHPPRDAV